MHRNRDQIELQLDNRQIVSFVIGSLVVLGVVFALGVMVGKQLAVDGSTQETKPLDPLAAIDAREKALIASADAAVGTGELPAAKEDAPLTFAQELTRPKPVDPVIEPTKAANEKPVVRREEPADEPAAKREEPALVKAEPAQPKGREGLAAAFEKVAPKPASGSLALQAASLPNRSDAEKVVSKLSGKGYSAYIVEAEIPNKGTFYRVKVGSFASRDEANQALAEFKGKTGMDAIVTSAR